MPRYFLKSAKRPISGSPMVPVPTTCTIFFMAPGPFTGRAGQSEGRHDEGRGEVDDFRAALEEAIRRGGLPVLAAGFSFGSTVALRASAADARVAALIAVGLPLASLPVESLPRPRVPALFVTGERDAFGPPALLMDFVRDSGEIVIVPGADHFF